MHTGRSESSHSHLVAWGIIEEGLRSVPPIFYRNFGLSLNPDSDGSAHHTGEPKQKWRRTDGGMGLSVGKVLLEDGS